MDLSSLPKKRPMKFSGGAFFKSLLDLAVGLSAFLLLYHFLEDMIGIFKYVFGADADKIPFFTLWAYNVLLLFYLVISLLLVWFLIRSFIRLLLLVAHPIFPSGKNIYFLFNGFTDKLLAGIAGARVLRVDHPSELLTSRLISRPLFITGPVLIRSVSPSSDLERDNPFYYVTFNFHEEDFCFEITSSLNTHILAKNVGKNMVLILRQNVGTPEPFELIEVFF